MPDNPMAIYNLPKDWNANEAEGRQAFKDGRMVDSHRYGESSAASDFERGWRAEQTRAKK